MKQKLVNISNNCGVVSDENGNVSFIEKESDSSNLKEILLKENNLEELKSKLEDYKNKLSLNKQDIIFGNISSVALITMESALFAFLHSVLPVLILLIVMAISYVPFKAMSVVTFGTRIGRHIKKNKLTTDIKSVELELSTLEKELVNIKENSKYKVLYSTLDENKTSVKEKDSEIESYILNEKNKVKVLSLMKKK